MHMKGAQPMAYKEGLIDVDKLLQPGRELSEQTVILLKKQEHDFLIARIGLQGTLWGPGCVKRAGDLGFRGFRQGCSCFKIRSLGLRGLGDASVHRWRRSAATDTASAQPGRLCRRGEPGSSDRGLHRRAGSCGPGICRDDTGGVGTAGLPSLDAAEDLPLWLPQPRAVEPAAGTRSTAQY